jgi:response regulator of citrate/malate metabolism
MKDSSVLVIEEACPPELLAEVRATFSSAVIVSSLAQARRSLQSSDFDVVLCGVHLPDGNWADVMSCLVHNGREADFVLCAARDDARLRTEVLGRGGAALVPPPYRLPKFNRTANQAMAKA